MDSFSPPFVLFGPAHVATILTIAVACVAIPLWARRLPNRVETIAKILAAVMVIVELTKVFYRVVIFEVPLKWSLPLHLCGVAVFLSIALLWWHAKAPQRSYAIYEVVYFWGLAGTLQAVLTPDMPVGFPHPAYLAFFASHGLVLVAVFYATWTFRFRPTWRSIGKAFLWLNFLALFVTPINLLLDTNYLFLRAKPYGASLMDYFGPWPWYILVLEGIAVISFLLYYAPFALTDLWRRSRNRDAVSRDPGIFIQS